MELCEQAGLHHHLTCSHDRFVAIEYVAQVQHGSAACPHFVSFFNPFSVFQVAATLVSICLADAVEVRAQADFAGPHLRDNGADRSRQLAVQGEVVLVWFPAERVEMTSMPGIGPDIVPVFVYVRVDSGLSCCNESCGVQGLEHLVR